MPDKPRDAKWLSAEERSWLQNTIDSEHKAVAAVHGTSVLRAFADPRLIALAFIYFANTTTNLGLAFFLPQILKGLGLSNTAAGLLTAVPYIVGTIGILAWAMSRIARASGASACRWRCSSRASASRLPAGS